MNLIDEALMCLKSELPSGSRLIVFGSQARGDASDDSDLDLLVVEPEVADRFAEMARLTTLLGKQLIPADVVVMSADTFEQQGKVVNTLAWRALREGKAHELVA